MAPTTFETGHIGVIHDAQVDAHGTTLATASADSCVRIWKLHGDEQVLSAELKGHTGPVYQVAWASPKFGAIVASASSDNTMVLWRCLQDGDWEVWHRQDSFLGAVTSCQFAPPSYGLQIAAACGDGSVIVVRDAGVNFIVDVVPSMVGVEEASSRLAAHTGAATAVCWGPPPSDSAASQSSRRLASAGSDGHVAIWQADEKGLWTQLQRIDVAGTMGVAEWVRDVSWRPGRGVVNNVLAVCIGTRLGTFAQAADGQLWSLWEDREMGHTVYKALWNTLGTVLSVSLEDGSVRVFKENLRGNAHQFAFADASGVHPPGPPEACQGTSVIALRMSA